MLKIGKLQHKVGYNSLSRYVCDSCTKLRVYGLLILLCKWYLWQINQCCSSNNKKAQLSLTNPRDAKACQKLLQFDVLTTLSLTILVYLHAFSYCCVQNLRNPTKFTENSNLWSSRSSKVIDLGANRKPICNLLLVINSNFSRICYRFRDIHG